MTGRDATEMARKVIYLLLISMLCFLGTAYPQRASKSRLVGNVSAQALVDGCGCYFQFRGTNRDSAKYMFAESIEEQVGIWMNIDGRDVQLKVVKDWSHAERERVGSRSSRTFTAHNISVTSTYVVTRVCAANDENCESHDYNATFVVRKGGRVETVRATGNCGC